MYRSCFVPWNVTDLLMARETVFNDETERMGDSLGCFGVFVLLIEGM